MRGLWTHLERLGAAAAASARGARASPRSRPTAASRATASPRCKRRLERTKATRATMRQERERAGLPTVALAGYTNAGKSTLLNALTGAEVGVRDRLFHTLDPTTRSFEIAGRTLPADRHGRLHPQAAAPAGRGLLGHARGGAGRRPDPARGRRLGCPRSELHEMMAAVDEVLDEIGAGEHAAPARPQQGRPARRRAPARADVPLPATRSRCPAATGEGLDELRERDRGALPGDAAPDGAARALRRGRQPVRAARPRRRAGARGHRRRACASGRACRRGVAPRFERFSVNGATARRPTTSDAALHAPHARRRGAEPRPRRRRRLRPATRPRRRALEPGERASVGTGIAVAIPEGQRRPGAAALGPRGQARHLGRQRARPDRRRLPRRAARAAAEHRPRESFSVVARGPHRAARAGAPRVA